jgi:hypothetical protein
MGSIIWGGVIASPLIGLLMGMLYKPAYKLPKVGQVFVSLTTLYLAATLFGLAMGIYDAYWRAIPNRRTSGVVIQAVLAPIWGLTFLGYFMALWPLSYFNHKVLGRWQKAV